jgi:hypothetical protein
VVQLIKKICHGISEEFLDLLLSYFGSGKLQLEDVGQFRRDVGVERTGKVPRLDDPVVVKTPEIFEIIKKYCTSRTYQQIQFKMSHQKNGDLQFFSLLVVTDKLRQLRLEIERRWKPFRQSLKLLTFTRVVDDSVGHSTADGAEEVFNGQNVFKWKLVDPL